MKKKIFLFSLFFAILVVGFFSTSYGYLKSEETIDGYGSYEQASKMVKEVMKSYYMRGPLIQYNSSKSDYVVISPEEATKQEIKYDVCSVFVYDVYGETFGMSYSKDKFPRSSAEIIQAGKNYYDSGRTRDGNFLVYYEDTVNSKKYIYNNATNFDDFVKQIKPGDIFAYTGHALLAYDVVVNPSTGKKDVLILNSNSGPYVSSRIESTTNSRISHNMFKSKWTTNGKNGFLDIDAEGTIQWRWLSSDSRFVKNGKISCSKAECTVIRPFYENSDKEAVFNYGIEEKNYKKSLLRTEYPGLLIEKTVNVNDNNSVYVGDELTYTIKITNKNSVEYNPVNYKGFYIEETLSDYVDYVSMTVSGQISGKTLKWKIDKLANNETKTLSYTVKVKDNLSNVSKTINSTGRFYSVNDSIVSISTGTVKNKIIPKVSSLKNSYQTCYKNKKDSYSGLELINEIYKCTSNKDFNFTNFKFENIFGKKVDVVSKGTKDVIYFKSNMDTLAKSFSGMILNNYWGGLVKYKESATSSNYYYNVPEWAGTSAGLRAKEIYDEHFKDGDVLIYSIDYSTTPLNLIHTKESGLYAYIYIDGKFVGKNYSGTKGRNEFTYDYYNEKSLDIATHLYTGYSKLISSERTSVLEFVNYQTLLDKDYYVILRPEVAIKENVKINVTTKPTKINYIQNYEKLNLTGGEITITNNNGTTEKVSLSNSNVIVTGFNNKKVGTNTLTVKYNNLTTTFNVNIISKQITKIEVTKKPTKLNYTQGYENLDLTGGEIIVTYNDGSKEPISLPNKNIEVTGFNNTKLGKNTLTVKYANLTTKFDINIIAKKINKIEVTKKPIKINYAQGYENLDLTGGEITVTYSDNTKDKISLTSKGVIVTGFDNTKLGKNTLIVKYANLTTKFDIEIIENVNEELNEKNNTYMNQIIILGIVLTIFIGSLGYSIHQRKK